MLLNGDKDATLRQLRTQTVVYYGFLIYISKKLKYFISYETRDLSIVHTLFYNFPFSFVKE